MAHTTAGRKLGRKSGFRQQMLRSLATDLLRYEKIETTIAKAKEASRLTNHLISVAKQGTLNSRRAVARDIRDKQVQKKLFDVLAQRYESRTGGFTRIFRAARRQGDNAEIAVIKLIA